MTSERLDNTVSDQRQFNKDETCSRRFWDRMTKGKRPEYLENKRRAMMGIISDAINNQNGRLSMFVTRSIEGRFDEEDRELISAYRELAKEMGYVLGPMTHNGGDETASGFLTKVK